MQQAESGCLQCTNCIFTVPQDKFFAVERFGSFYQIYGPGLNFGPFDLCGCCISLRSITSRVQQLIVNVPTKTQDNVFINCCVAVQFAVLPQKAQDAFYKLTDVGPQIDSFVSDVVRSQIPKMELDATFENKDKISEAVMQDLKEHMGDYGFEVVKALVVDMAVSQEVVRSMNEINKQKRLRDASVMAAEAEKIRTVRAAEADADAACLVGEGIARQRAAIVQGLRDSISQTGRTVSTDDITELLLATQYFETLKDIGSHNNCKAYFLPEDDKDLDAQIRRGMLEGQAALEYLRLHHRVSGGPAPPPQQSMGQPQSSPSPEPDLPQPSRMQDDMRPPPSPPQPVQQRMTLQVQVPQGVQPGQTLQVQVPDGRVINVQIPQGVRGGQIVQVQV